MKKHLLAFIITAFLYCCGCATPPDPSDQDRKMPSEIIAENYSAYTNSTEISNITIGSLFKYYMDYAYGRSEDSWEDIYNVRDEYLNRATNQYINVNYPVKAQYGEGIVLKDFSDDVIDYTQDLEAGPNSYRTYFIDMSSIFIKMINNYEYDKDR